MATPKILDHWTHHRTKDDPVMLALAKRIRRRPWVPRWLTSQQYEWLLMNEGERYGWFSKLLAAAKVEYRHWWRKGEKHPTPSYLITPPRKGVPCTST